MQPKNIISILTVLIIVAALSGYYFGATQIIPAPKFLKIERGISVDQLVEFERYKKAVEMMSPPISEEIFAISGTVTEIKDNFLIIEMPSLTERVLPGEEPKTEERKIVVAESTKLIKMIPFSSPVIEPGKEMPILEEETFKLSDLKPGDRINAESSENIKNKKEFAAAKIVFFPMVVSEEIVP